MATLMDGTTARLVDFALRAKYSDLSHESVAACKRRLIDTLACMVAAYDKPLSHNARSVAKRYSSERSPASVLGCTWKTMPEAATFANGVMMRSLALMQPYLNNTRGHACDVVTGILAVGEAVDANGAAVINGVTLAYDIY